MDTIEDLVNKNLVDATYNFEMPPQIDMHPKFYEIMKRNIGLQISRMKGCTHQMSMDTDEYYHKDEFENMKKRIEEEDWDAGACGIISYFKDPTYQITPVSNYHVSTIFKIRDDIKYGTFVQNGREVMPPWPVFVDPTRRCKLDHSKILVFKEEEIMMHHMSFVRKNLEAKFRSSSADIVKNNQDMLEDFLERVKTYELGKPLPLFKPKQDGDAVETTIKVENIFNVPKF